jgi:CRISPR-associated endonuclease/helicase Cas3
MSGLTVERFGEFFAAVNDGHAPFRWQAELLERVCATGHWPDAIVAPTGSGKSSVVDVHVYANALSTLGRAVRVPRRMAVVVNRRGLVDMHAQRAERIGRALAQGAGICGEVSAVLAQLSVAGQPLVLANLRGGLPPIGSWMDDPAACAVISATPDMWGSRLLFRGYGSARNAWPRAAGLAGNDCALVIDEAHLNRQLCQTASDVARLNRTYAPALGIPALQVVAMTATPPDGGSGCRVLAVDPGALSDARDEALRTRLFRAKLVAYVPAAMWPGPAKASQGHVHQLADAAKSIRSSVVEVSGSARTIGCFVNRVDTAVRVASLLESEYGREAVACWVGRMRPMDLDGMRAANPDLFTVRGDDRVAFLVATQTVEVGVDLDLAGLVTELADGAALAQRFGRVNRRGLRPSAEVRVIGPEGEAEEDALPYRRADLEAARTWLLNRGKDGVSPSSLLADPPPAPALSRLVLSDLTAGHAEFLACTSMPLFEEPELAFWLRDDLEPDQDPVSFVVRRLPEDDSSAVALINAAAPAPEEAFPARIGDARRIVERLVGVDGHGPDLGSRCFRWDGEAASQLLDPDRLRPGDTLIVDDTTPLTRQRVVDPDATEAEDFPLGRGVGVARVFMPGADEDDLVLEALDGLEPDEVQERFDELFPAPDPLHGCQVFVPATGSDVAALPWAVARLGDVLADDSELRQAWSPAAAPVGLDEHQEAVAGRARAIGRNVGLPDDVLVAIADGAAHHDDGKADPRFQRDVLGAAPGRLLAKSGGGAQFSRRRAQSAALPPGWRHEQLSAAYVCADATAFEDPQLVARLVGTSHGRGRPFFPHAARSAGEGQDAGRLLAGDEPARLTQAARNLFATGAGWDDVLVGTTHRFGHWGCAYLEALLRAADCTVSKEGS